jgi:hypothetical protein
MRLLIAERLKAIHLIRQRCPATGDTHQGSLDLSGRLLARSIEQFGRLVTALGCINHVFVAQSARPAVQRVHLSVSSISLVGRETVSVQAAGFS